MSLLKVRNVKKSFLYEQIKRSFFAVKMQNTVKLRNDFSEKRL